MFSFHSKYCVYRELKRAPQKSSFCLKCPDTATVRILRNILYHTGHVLVRAAGMGSRAGLHAQRLVTAMRLTNSTYAEVVAFKQFYMS